MFKNKEIRNGDNPIFLYLVSGRIPDRAAGYSVFWFTGYPAALSDFRSETGYEKAGYAVSVNTLIGIGIRIPNTDAEPNPGDESVLSSISGSETSLMKKYMYRYI